MTKKNKQSSGEQILQGLNELRDGIKSGKKFKMVVVNKKGERTKTFGVLGKNRLESQLKDLLNEWQKDLDKAEERLTFGDSKREDFAVAYVISRCIRAIKNILETTK